MARGDNLETDPLKIRLRMGRPPGNGTKKDTYFKFMLSISEEMYLALCDEMQNRGVISFQEQVRFILSDWYSRRRKEIEQTET